MNYYNLALAIDSLKDELREFEIAPVLEHGRKKKRGGTEIHLCFLGELGW